jgi:hypothetical protein
VDEESLHEFENQLVKSGILPQFKDFYANVKALRQKTPDEATAREWIDLAKAVHKACLEKEAEVIAASPRKKPSAQPQPDNLFI